LFCLGGAVVLALIDALSETYSLELGPLGLLLGTGTILLGVEGVRKAAERLVNGSGG
jgi:hypothetical protein